MNVVFIIILSSPFNAFSRDFTGSYWPQLSIGVRCTVISFLWSLGFWRRSGAKRGTFIVFHYTYLLLFIYNCCCWCHTSWSANVQVQLSKIFIGFLNYFLCLLVNDWWNIIWTILQLVVELIGRKWIINFLIMTLLFLDPQMWIFADVLDFLYDTVGRAEQGIWISYNQQYN